MPKDLLTMVAAVLEHCYDEDTEVSICAHELLCETARLCSIPSVRRLIGETMTKLYDELVGDVDSEQWPQRRRAGLHLRYSFRFLDLSKRQKWAAMLVKEFSATRLLERQRFAVSLLEVLFAAEEAPLVTFLEDIKRLRQCHEEASACGETRQFLLRDLMLLCR